MCFFCTRGLGSLGQESDVFQTRAVQKPRPSMAISGWSICRIMLGRRAISLKASWCLLGLSLGEVRSALANYLCAMLMDTRNTGDPVGWYSEITEFVQMFPFYPFPPIRGGMAVQQVTTNGIAFRIALQYLRITKGAWHFGSILRRWHIWKLLALQPHKDLDRGWSIGPEPAENHPPGLWRLCQWRRQPSSFGARWDSATGRSTSAEFGHVFITNPPWLTWSTWDLFHRNSDPSDAGSPSFEQFFVHMTSLQLILNDWFLYHGGNRLNDFATFHLHLLLLLKALLEPEARKICSTLRGSYEKGMDGGAVLGTRCQCFEVLGFHLS